MRGLLIILSLMLVLPPSYGAGKVEHVVVVVWDGLRPDSINAQDTPTLYKLAAEGVFFKNHHPVYVSSTEVNAVALATGATPAHNGIMGNREYRPAIDPLKYTDTQSHTAVRKGDELSGGHYIALPTIAEILQHAGYRTAVAGTKPVALLLDRMEQGRVCTNCINYFAGHVIPSAAEAQTKEEVFTPGGTPNTRQDEATTLSLIGPQWDAGVPKLSMLWLSEPDLTQHATGLGSPPTRAALKSSDANLSRVLNELDSRGERDKTDVFVVSDHGFSTVSRNVDVAAALKKAGFSAARKYEEPPTNGDVMVVGEVGTVLLYVKGHDLKLILKLVEFLQQQDFIGVIFTRSPMKGTFTLDQVGINTKDAPDIAVSMHWTAEKNSEDIQGMLVNDSTSYVSGRGSHASLSPFDMHNTLVVAGPDFRQGMIDDLPSGNIDVAPTVLAVLGVPQPRPMDGRVLTEAFVGGDVARTVSITSSNTSRIPLPEQTEVVTGKTVPALSPAPVVIEELSAEKVSDTVHWHQYLRVVKYGGSTYFDEGNGGPTPK